MRVLVAGWFSFEDMGATAGDLICRDLLVEWLREANVPCDVAVAAPFTDGVSWEQVPPENYSHVIFVCGPFGNGWPVTDLLARFAGVELIGLNLTMLDDLENWNPFDLLLERDSSLTARPDLTLQAPARPVPLVGLILADRQKEYGPRAMHDVTNEAIDRLLTSREAAVVPIDTRLDHNRTGLRSAAEVESLIARMDLVVTTRLHGTVLAIKNGVPPLVVDPIAGGHKVARQAAVLDWPVCFAADCLDDAELQQAFAHCLSTEARARAVRCAERAQQVLGPVRRQLLQHLERVRQEV
jgi:hypothetical protein